MLQHNSRLGLKDVLVCRKQQKKTGILGINRRQYSTWIILSIPLQHFVREETITSWHSHNP
jgi:hypothetical protein